MVVKCRANRSRQRRAPTVDPDVDYAVVARPGLHGERASGADRERRHAAVAELLTEQMDNLGDLPLLNVDHPPSLGQTCR